MSSYHTTPKKTKKWYGKVSFELLTGTCVVNVLILYNKFITKAFPILKFKESLVDNLTKSNPTKCATSACI